jgi:hypothetical protein
MLVCHACAYVKRYVFGVFELHHLLRKSHGALAKPKPKPKPRPLPWVGPRPKVGARREEERGEREEMQEVVGGEWDGRAGLWN